MTFGRYAYTVAATGIAAILLAAGASANTITYSTNGPGTGFGGSSLIQTSATGVPATLTFVPNVNVATGVPSNVNFGNFTLLCITCSTQALGAGSFFNPFTFDLVITDATNNASGKFIGASTGGAVFSNVSQITINWSPLQLGPGVSMATLGSFGTTTFNTTIFTGIVAPNSGVVPGQSTIQGSVNVVPVPESVPNFLIGAALIGLGTLRRRSTPSE